MATPPDVYTWVNGEDLLAQNMQERIEDVFNYLYNPPMIRLRRTAAGSIPNNSQTPVSWDFVEVEVTNMWDSANPAQIKPSVPGWYVGSCGWSFAHNATGYRYMAVHKNSGFSGNVVIKNFGTGYNTASMTSVSRGNVFLVEMNGTTDYLTMYLAQNSGGSLALQVNTQESQADFTLRWIAKS